MLTSHKHLSLRGFLWQTEASGRADVCVCSQAKQAANEWKPALRMLCVNSFSLQNEAFYRQPCSHQALVPATRRPATFVITFSACQERDEAAAWVLKLSLSSGVLQTQLTEGAIIIC